MDELSPEAWQMFWQALEAAEIWKGHVVVAVSQEPCHVHSLMPVSCCQLMRKPARLQNHASPMLALLNRDLIQRVYTSIPPRVPLIPSPS